MLEPEVRKIHPRIIQMLLIFLLCLGLSGWQVFALQLRPVDPNDSSSIEVRVPEDSSARGVASFLKQNGLIRSELVFLSYCRQQGLDKELKPGLYVFSKSQSVKELAIQISQGKVKSSSLTIPEGYTVRQIGELLVKKQICTPQQWQEALQADYHYDFLVAEQPKDEHRLEGFLFPATYTFDENTSAQDMIEMMLASFDQMWNKEYAEQAASKQLSVRYIITVASLIEREAKIPEERTRISGVIYNRLQKGMPLQIDATVLYSLGEHKETVSYRDLEVNSPYNTYKYTGLPPGPIASPGRAAIDAALNPEKNSYYYYVAKGDNSHYFSSSYAEHLEAKSKYGQ
jgi:UPF0755 protein